MRPVICAITDGHLTSVDHAGLWLARVAAAAQAGAHLIQVRERGLDDRTLSAIVRRCREVVRGTSARVVVNDRLDVALACGADGVHLRSDSYSARRAREIAPRGFLVGRSIHTVAEAAAVGDGADYLIFGTVFPTSSKPGRTPVGTAALAAAVLATPVPVLAVGGVTADTAGAVARAGAAGVAAIGSFAGSTAEDVATSVDRIARAFDLAMSGS